MTVKTARESIYQLKVTLKGIRPPIWRRIQVPGDITLYKLHKILQIVMGWNDYHLYQFIIDNNYYGEPDPEFDDIETKNAKRTKLTNVVTGEKAKFTYEYDFGDGWNHQIVVEKILPPKEGGEYPTCLSGKRACPPEDCGGIWGYSDLLTILQNPGLPEYEEMITWLGGEFDPEYFDLEDINRRLRSIR